MNCLLANDNYLIDVRVYFYYTVVCEHFSHLCVVCQWLFSGNACVRVTCCSYVLKFEKDLSMILILRCHTAAVLYLQGDIYRYI